MFEAAVAASRGGRAAYYYLSVYLPISVYIYIERVKF